MMGVPISRPVGCAVAAFALVVCTPTAIESGGWWNSPRVVSALHLTNAQRAAIARIYREAYGERARLVERAAESRAALDRLMDTNASEADIEAAAARAADDEAARRRTRTLMLYRMLRVLTPLQRQRLSEIERLRRSEP